MENSTSESGIFNSSLMHKINRKCKPCLFSQKLKRNLTKYLFDFFYYRELYNFCSANLFFYQCFTEYQLMTWKLEMNNIINIFHLDIKNYEEEVDDTLTKCIQKKRTYSMKDHPGCFIRINKEGINIISIAYYDLSIQKDFGYINYPYLANNEIDDDINTNLKIDENENNLRFSKKRKNTIESISISEAPSNLGSIGSIITVNKDNSSNPWIIKYLDDSYNNNESILINKTAPINFGFSFYHVVKGDYQLYLHHSLINMKNARLILQVSINGNIIYTLDNFPSNDLIEQDNREEKEKEKNIKLKEYLICSLTKKMFDQSGYNLNDIEDFQDNEGNIKCKDYEVRVTFKNQDLFWKAGWCVDGGRLLRKRYELNESSVNKSFKRFKSENINIFESIKKHESDVSKNSIKKSIVKMKSDYRTDI